MVIVCWSYSKHLYFRIMSGVIHTRGESPQDGLRDMQIYKITVVVTTRLMSNSSTSNKSQWWISSRKHKLCNSQENLTGNHNSILPTIYINYSWSMLQLHICCASYPNVYALSSYPLLIYLMSYYSSTMHLSQGQYAVYMCPDIIS